MNITERVESILRFSKKARNSDKELEIIFMQKSGMELTDRQIEAFKQMPSMETLRRIRQKLQQQGKYPADEEVNEARYRKYKEMKQEIVLDVSPEQLLEQRGYTLVDD